MYVYFINRFYFQVCYSTLGLQGALFKEQLHEMSMWLLPPLCISKQYRFVEEGNLLLQEDGPAVACVFRTCS